VEFFYQPIGGQFYSKLCPATVTPKFLIKEIGETKKQEKDCNLKKNSKKTYIKEIDKKTDVK
jgi:hypothetical protein